MDPCAPRTNHLLIYNFAETSKNFISHLEVFISYTLYCLSRATIDFEQFICVATFYLLLLLASSRLLTLYSKKLNLN